MLLWGRSNSGKINYIFNIKENSFFFYFFCIFVFEGIILDLYLINIFFLDYIFLKLANNPFQK